MSLDNLPVGWSVQKFEKVVFKIVGGGTPSKNNPEYYLGNIPWMSVKDMNKNILEDTVDHITQEAIDNSATNLIPKGTPIIATRMSLGKVVVANFDSAINQDLKAIFLDDNIDKNFFFYWYRSQSKLIESLGTGTTVKGIRLEVINNLDFPVVPLAEQQEIVCQLDVMLAQVEHIKARLDAIPAILKKFRQSVLADAVSGKLTEDANYSKWIKSTIGAEFKCVDGDRGKNYPKKEDYQTEGYCLFLSTKNVRKFGFLFDEKVFISKQKHEQLRNGTLQRDDLIITTRGTLGHIASYDKNVPFDVVRINSGMLILRKTKQNLLNEFMMLLLASPKFQRIIEEQRTGSAQPQLPAKILKEFEIELPSLDEQKILIKKVESYFKLIEKIEKTVQSVQKRVNLLTQSILAKAFSGELTAEWREQHHELIAGVNSAESLLAKIQAEREASKPVKKVKKTK